MTFMMTFMMTEMTGLFLLQTQGAHPTHTDKHQEAYKCSCLATALFRTANNVPVATVAANALPGVEMLTGMIGVKSAPVMVPDLMISTLL